MRPSVPLMHVEKRIWLSATDWSLEAVGGYGFGLSFFMFFERRIFDSLVEREK